MSYDPNETPVGIKIIFWAMVVGIVVALAMLSSCPAESQVPPDLPSGTWGAVEGGSPALDPKESAPGGEGRQDPPRLVASWWCPVTLGDDSDSPGCDVGLGISLVSVKRLAWVAVVGIETLGTGVAWVAYRPKDDGPTVAVAVGAVVRFDESGIDGTEVFPAIGFTFGWGGRR